MTRHPTPLAARISKDFEFSASHRLEGLDPDHPCSRLHGHNYRVTLEITGTLDETGFVVDYRDLSWFKEYIDEVLDHRHLNDALPFLLNPTAELLAAHLWEFARTQLVDHEERENVHGISVSVSETPKTLATVSGIPSHIERDL